MEDRQLVSVHYTTNSVSYVRVCAGMNLETRLSPTVFVYSMYYSVQSGIIYRQGDRKLLAVP